MLSGTAVEPMPERLPQRVLVVDDEPLVCDLLARGLSARGLVVETAADGQEALEAVRREPPDLVLIDICLPKLDGLEVLRRLQEERPRIPVITLSGAGDEEVARRSLDLGAADFLMKPFSLEYLRTTVLAALSLVET